MESRRERIEKIRKETDEEVREAMESSVSLIPEVNPETLEPEEEEEDLTVRIYEAVAEEYRELYQSFDLENYFKTDDGKMVVGKVKERVNSDLSEGKTDPFNASYAIRSLFAIISTPELKEQFTAEEINGWLVQVGDDGLKRMARECMNSNLSKGKTDPANASYAIRSLSAIISTPELKKLFSEEINDWLVQAGDDDFKGKVGEHVNSYLSQGKTDPFNASLAIRTLSAIISTPELKKLFSEEISGWLVQAGDDGFKRMVKERVNSDLSEGKTSPGNAFWAIGSLSAIHRFSEALSSEASRLRAEPYDKGKGKETKPVVPRLPEIKI